MKPFASSHVQMRPFLHALRSNTHHSAYRFYISIIVYILNISNLTQEVRNFVFVFHFTLLAVIFEFQWFQTMLFNNLSHKYIITLSSTIYNYCMFHVGLFRRRRYWMVIMVEFFQVVVDCCTLRNIVFLPWICCWVCVCVCVSCVFHIWFDASECINMSEHYSSSLFSVFKSNLMHNSSGEHLQYIE